MNTWILVAIITVIVAAAVAGVSALAADSNANKLECKTCGNSCDVENNCGLQTCGAANGGTCGCGK